jgi:hypothetical protein
MPLALGVEFVATSGRVPRSLAWLLRLTLAAAMGRILLHHSVYLSGREPQWSAVHAALMLTLCSGLIALVWVSLAALSGRSHAGISIPLALALTIQTAGICIMVAGYLQGGAAAFPLSAAAVGTAGSLWLIMPRPNADAPISISVVGLASLLLIGRFFGGLSTEVALLLLLSPLLCWVTELLPLRSQPAWLVGVGRLLLVAIPLTVLLVQAKTKFDRDTAPLLGAGQGSSAPR